MAHIETHLLAPGPTPPGRQARALVRRLSSPPTREQRDITRRVFAALALLQRRRGYRP